MIGRTISHYKILEELGEGGMGVVYKAIDLRLQRKVALKMLPIPIGGLSKSERERFLLEARATSSLDHPNICTVYEVDETPEGHALIAMALYEGETLAQRIKRGALDHEEIVRIASQIGLGLQAAHEQGIVHRDIKSSNIMVTKTGQVKIMDFGVAKYVAGEGITQSGIRIGTLAYMSPEQAQGKVIDQRADIWSFGVVLHEMISGTLPFDASYEFGLLYAIIHDRPSVLSQHQPNVHPEFQSIIDKCLEKDPQRRYSTAGQVVDHLLSVGTLPPPAKSITAVKRIFRRGIRFVRIRWAATILTACFVITGLVLLLVLRSAEIQGDVITFEIKETNQVSGMEQSSVVKKEVLEYLLRDELEQSSNMKILTRTQFSKFYLGKTPEVELIVNVQVQPHITEIEVRVQQASVSPLRPGVTNDTTYQFTDPLKLLKSITPSIADRVLRVVGIDQKKASTFTSSWEAFERFYEGEKAWQKLEVPKAQNAYKQALSIDPSFVLARLRYADVLRFDNAYASAQAHVHMIESQLGKLSAVDSLRARALIALFDGDQYKHVEFLREVYEHKPWAVESPYFLAEGFYQLCLIKEAGDHYLKALDIDSNFALAHNHLAYCYTHLGDHPRALEEFQNYVRLDSSANSYDSYGDGLFSAGMLDSAAWAKKRGLSLDPKMTYLYKTLFYIRLFQGQLKKAQECVVNFRGTAYTDDLKAQAELFDALLNYFNNRNGDALSHCVKALRIFDGKDVLTRSHDLHWLLGLIYLRMGQWDDAKQELKEMDKLISDHHIDAANYTMFLYKSTRHLRACLAAKEGDFKTVNDFEADLDGPLKTKVKDHASPFDLAFFYTELGKLYLEPRINRADYAEDCFKKSLIYNSHFPFAHHQLWLLYRRMNKPEQAAEHRNQLNEIWKNADPEWKAIYLPELAKK
jgi:serine/threonine protein kinase/Tfp pilus assembly protein PilF